MQGYSQKHSKTKCEGTEAQSDFADHPVSCLRFVKQPERDKALKSVYGRKVS